MAVLNRALTLATRGLLAGSAIALATNGLIQIDSGVASVAAQDSQHRHTAELVTWPFTGTPPELDVVSRVGTAVMRPFDDKEIEDLLEQVRQVDHHHVSHLRLRLYSSARWQQYSEPSYEFRWQGHSDILLFSRTFADQGIDARPTGRINLHLFANSTVTFNTPFVYRNPLRLELRGEPDLAFHRPSINRIETTNTLTLKGLATTEFLEPGELVVTSRNELTLTSEAVTSFDPVVIIPPKTYEHKSMGLIVVAGSSRSVLTEAPVSSYKYVPEDIQPLPTEHAVSSYKYRGFKQPPRLVLMGEAAYQLSASALSVQRFDAGGGIILSGSAQYAFIPYAPPATIDDDDEELILMAAAMLLFDD